MLAPALRGGAARVPPRRPAVRSPAALGGRAQASGVSLSSDLSAGRTSFPSQGPRSGGAAVEPGKAAMERRPPRRSRGGARPASRPPVKSRPPAQSRAPAQPQGSRLWLFPDAPGLGSALSRRAEATRQVCCARGRLAVLERGGAGVQVHQLPAGSDGAKKPSEWGRATPARPSGAGRGWAGGSPGPAPAPQLLAAAARVVGARSFSRRGGEVPSGLGAAGVPYGPRNAPGPGGFSGFAPAAALGSPRSCAPSPPSSRGGSARWVVLSAGSRAARGRTRAASSLQPD